MSDTTESESDGGIDPRRLKRALIIYFVLGLVAVTGWQVWRFVDDKTLRFTATAADQRVTDDFVIVRLAAAAFESSHGRPATGWDELIDAGHVQKAPIDPWRRYPYRYLSGSGGFCAFTYGRDGEEGGEGYDADRFSTGE